MAEEIIHIPKAQFDYLLSLAVPEIRYTIVEAAAYLHISDVTLWRLRRQGIIKTRLVGKRPFITRTELDKYLAKESEELYV